VRKYRIISIDPGTTTCGFSVIECDYGETPKVLWAETVNALPYLKYNQPTILLHGKKFARIRMIGQRLQKLLDFWKPDAVIGEACFMGRFPKSFQGLTELTYELRSTTANFDPTLPYEIIDPPTVKNNMGVSGKSKDKDDMTEGLRNYDVTYELDIDTNSFDEHTVDAISVGLWWLRKVCGK